MASRSQLSARSLWQSLGPGEQVNLFVLIV